MVMALFQQFSDMPQAPTAAIARHGDVDKPYNWRGGTRQFHDG
jgi:hypothetical protein